MNDENREERIRLLMLGPDGTNQFTRAQAEEIDDISLHAAEKAGEALLAVIKTLPPELQVMGNFASLMALQAKVEYTIAVLEDVAEPCQCPGCQRRRAGEQQDGNVRIVEVGSVDELMNMLGLRPTTKH